MTIRSRALLDISFVTVRMFTGKSGNLQQKTFSRYIIISRPIKNGATNLMLRPRPSPKGEEPVGEPRQGRERATGNELLITLLHDIKVGRASVQREVDAALLTLPSPSIGPLPTSLPLPLPLCPPVRCVRSRQSLRAPELRPPLCKVCFPPFPFYSPFFHSRFPPSLSLIALAPPFP